MGIIVSQELARRAHTPPECHHIGRLDVFPPDNNELYPDGPPALYQQNIPASPPPMYAVAVGERI